MWEMMLVTGKKKKKRGKSYLQSLKESKGKLFQGG
jgi:hypothetical protein